MISGRGGVNSHTNWGTGCAILFRLGENILGLFRSLCQYKGLCYVSPVK